MYRSILLALGLFALWLTPAHASDCADADCFKGQTLSVVVGYKPGGGYDAYARMLAPAIEARTGATVVVRNRPGGGGLVAVNELANARNDDLTYSLINVAAVVIAQGLRMEAVQFDIGTFDWLAGLRPERRVLVTPKGQTALPWTLDDADQLRWAAGGRADEMALGAALVSEAFGLDARIITGYGGTSEAILGVIRGEADAAIISADSARQYAEAREIEVIATLGSQRSALFPDVPTLAELTEDQAYDARWLDVLESLSALGRGFAAPPGTSAGHRAVLRDALHEALTDPALITAAEAAGRPIDYQDPQQLSDKVSSTLRAMAEDDKVLHVLGEKYR